MRDFIARFGSGILYIASAIIVAGGFLNLALNPRYVVGNSDDLIPPWLLGRLAAEGHGSSSYVLEKQAAMVKQHFEWDEIRHPKQAAGKDSHHLAPNQKQLAEIAHVKETGLCPYPPTAAWAYMPLGRMAFPEAAEKFRHFSLFLAIISAYFLWQASDRRITLVGCMAAILLYPGYYYILQIGQDSLVTFALVAGGWMLLGWSRDYLAGIVWGLLAFKLQWLAAVAWLPIALWRPKALVGMIGSAGLFTYLATSHIGSHSWHLWREQIERIDHLYAFDVDVRDKLLGMGCDLRSLIYRFAPQLPEATVKPLSWAAIGLVVAITWAVYHFRRNTVSLLFAACLAVPHLFYFDQVMFLLPLADLWGRCANFRSWQWVVALPLTLLFFAAVPMMLMHDWHGPPWATIAAVGLWALSLTLPMDDQ